MIAANTPPGVDSDARAKDQPEQAGRHSQGARRSLLILGGAGAVLLGVLAGIVLIAVSERDSTPRITRQDLQQAEERWQQRGPANYRMRIRLFGNQNEIIKVEVRNGEAVALSRNGYSPSQRRTWQYWTVPGMFETISTDMDHREDPESAFGVSDPEQVILRGRFDSQTGYPLDYHRLVLGGNAEIGWHVEEFRPLDSSAPPPSSAKPSAADSPPSSD